MSKLRLWTEKENLFLKKYYHTKGSKYIADALGRTRAAVRHHAVNLSVNVPGKLLRRPYTPQEIIYIKKNYPLKGSRYVAQKLRRTPNSISAKARSLRVERKSLLKWSKQEDEYLIKWYKKKRASKIAHRLGRTTKATIIRAVRLGLQKHETRRWTNEEELFLISNFRIMTYKQIGMHLNRSEQSVSRKIRNSFKMRKRKVRKWKPAEKRLLGRLYGKRSRAELAARFSRTPAAISSRAKVLKKTSKRPPLYTEKEKNFIRNNYLKMTNVQIAEKLKRKKESIQDIAFRLGLTGNPEKLKLSKIVKR
jgi:hypothetical protein